MKLPSKAFAFGLLAISGLMMAAASLIPWGEPGYYIADTLALAGILGYFASAVILTYGYLRPWLRDELRRRIG